MPTTSTRGRQSATSFAIAGQSLPLAPIVTTAIGLALRVSVSPAATPMRRRPKSKPSARDAGAAVAAPSRMTGSRTQPVEFDSKEPPGGMPAVLEGQAEHDGVARRHVEPGVRADFFLELAGLPAGIAERNKGVPGSGA